MAETDIPTGANAWQPVKRQYRVSRFSPVITIRRNGAIALSADFIRRANIAGQTRVSLFLSPDGQRLAMRFHSDLVHDDAFTLSRDGGHRNGATNRVIIAGALIKQSPILAGMIKAGLARRCEPTPRDGLWVIDLIPSFERNLASVTPGSDASGIYRYMLGDETVYIGRGNILERTRQHFRDDWHFDRIEYSILSDGAAKWEAFWLNDYRNRHGRWPIYNKIAGIASTGDDLGRSRGSLCNRGTGAS